jgi:hypothetical protein
MSLLLPGLNVTHTRKLWLLKIKPLDDNILSFFFVLFFVVVKLLFWTMAVINLDKKTKDRLEGKTFFKVQTRN